MFFLGSLMLMLLALILVFVSLEWAWVPLAFGVLIGGFLYIGVRGRKYGPVPELSPRANEMLARFGHFYAMPYAGTGVSSAASGLALAAMLLGLVYLLTGLWMGVGLCVILYVSAAVLASRFNPTRFLSGTEEEAAHDEIVAFLMEGDAD